MQSLFNIIKSVETNEGHNVLDAIETRKEQLQLLMESHPERADAIVNELHNLLAVTKTVENDDLDAALTELEVRKDELSQIAKDLVMMADDAAADDAAADDTAADDAAGKDAGSEAGSEAGAGEDAGTTDKANNTPLIVGSVAGVLILGGLIYYCRSKNDGSDHEGGNSDKKMFKAIIKKSAQKVAAKENLV